MLGSFEVEVIIKLGVAATLGGLIGLEREKHGRPAGLRTHILVSVGSALIMLVSIYGFARIGEIPGVRSYDPGRLAAQVVSGIGFLGAGTILREGASIKGLTTAASLWVVAGIGLGVGSGFFFGSIVATAIVIFALILLDKVEKRYLSNGGFVVALGIHDQPGQLGQIASLLGERKVNIASIDISGRDNGKATITIVIEPVPGQHLDRNSLLRDLVTMEGVISARYED